MTAAEADTKLSSDSASDWSDVMEDRMHARSAVRDTAHDHVERARQLVARARSERFAVLVAVDREEPAAMGLANLRARVAAA